MKNIATLLAKKKATRSPKWCVDEKTVFYVFRDIIRAEFGERGTRRFIPTYFKGHTLIVTAKDHVWGSELWTHRSQVAESINARIGQRGVMMIKAIYEGVAR